MAFTEDLSAFFDTDDFAVAGTFMQPDGTHVRAANVILDTPTEDLMDPDGRVVAASPRALCRTADVAGVARGWKLVIGAATYALVAPPRDDGTGVSTMSLRKE